MILKTETKFYNPKINIPKIPIKKITVNVYFIVENVLYKGTYHTNGHFHAYKITGDFDVFASATGIVKNSIGSSKNKICVGWCYIDDFKIITEE